MTAECLNLRGYPHEYLLLVNTANTILWLRGSHCVVLLLRENHDQVFFEVRGGG